MAGCCRMFCMSGLPGHNMSTIHVIVNNQIGLRQLKILRSSPYHIGLKDGSGANFHVNGDDETVVHCQN